MISWIKGEIVYSWQNNSKFFIIVNCQGLGYQIQVLESYFIKLKSKQISHKEIILWLKHIKKEDSDSLFGFISKDQKDFFIEILNIKGVGAQIGMAILNKYSIDEIINAITTKDKNLIRSVPGIGQKMTERIILELKSSFLSNINIQKDKKTTDLLGNNKELLTVIDDIELTLHSLNYTKKEIKKIIPVIKKEINELELTDNDKSKISFECLLKLAMNYLENNNGNLGI